MSRVKRKAVHSGGMGPYAACAALDVGFLHAAAGVVERRLRIRAWLALSRQAVLQLHAMSSAALLNICDTKNEGKKRHLPRSSHHDVLQEKKRAQKLVNSWSSLDCI